MDKEIIEMIEKQNLSIIADKVLLGLLKAKTLGEGEIINRLTEESK